MTQLFPPYVDGKVSANVQFTIPGLHIGKNKDRFMQLAKICGNDIWDVNLENLKDTRTQQNVTRITLAFYIEKSDNHEQDVDTIMSRSRLLIERYAGILSFCAGKKLSVYTQQPTIALGNNRFSTILYPQRRNSSSKTTISVPRQLLDNHPMSDDVFSALFWLRRGLADREPIETYNSLMVCLQILARELIKPVPTENKTNTNQERSLTYLVRELTVSKLGAPGKLFRRLWKARNAVVAHGNKVVTADVFVELTELKFEAAILAFKAIKLVLGIPMDDEPKPNQSFFITDAFMYLD